jgi:hypothetical protein
VFVLSEIQTLYATNAKSVTVKSMPKEFTINLYAFLLSLTFYGSSCVTRLNEISFKTKDIEVSKYEISEITSVHDFIEVKKGDSAITVLETNSYGFTDVIVRNDTIIIQYLTNAIYKFKEKAFGCNVYLDTTVSVEYFRQKLMEREIRNN